MNSGIKQRLFSTENQDFLKWVLRLAPPVILAELINALVNILDTVMIGRAMGVQEITAVALANRVFFVYVNVFWSLASGCGIFIGQYFGKKELHNIPKAVGVGLTGAMIICILFFIPSFIWPAAIIGLFSHDPYVIQMGADFLRIMSFSYFFVAITFTRNACMRNTGQTKIPMITTSSALIVNFVLNYIIIFVLGLPVYMVSVSTLISRIVELGLQQILIVKRNVPIRGTFKQYFSFDKTFLKEYYKVTVFIFLGITSWSIGTAIYDIAYGYAGTDSQGAIKIATSMMQLFQVLGISLGVATQVIMTNTLGSGGREKAIRYSRKCMITATVANSIMAVILVLMAPFIVWIFGPDEQVAHFVRMLVYIYAAGVILRSGNFVNLSGVLRSGGDTRFHFFVDLVAVYLIGIPMAFISIVHFKLPIYWAVTLVHMDELFKYVVSTLRILSNRWAKQLV